MPTLLALAIGAWGIGWVINLWRAHPLPFPYADAAQRLQTSVAALPHSPSPPAAVQYLTAAQVAAPPPGITYLPLDARSPMFFQAGHLPGALSLPRQSFAEAYPRLQPALADKALPLVVYCQGGECTDSALVAQSLLQLGHRQVFVLVGGWEAWQTLTPP